MVDLEEVDSDAEVLMLIELEANLGCYKAVSLGLASSALSSSRVLWEVQPQN